MTSPEAHRWTLDDLHVASFDATGAHRWSRRFSGAVGGVRARVDADARVIVAGNFSGPLDLGGLLEPPDAKNDIVIAGYVGGTVDVGTGPLVGTGAAYDAFLAKLGPWREPRPAAPTASTFAFAAVTARRSCGRGIDASACAVALA